MRGTRFTEMPNKKVPFGGLHQICWRKTSAISVAKRKKSPTLPVRPVLRRAASELLTERATSKARALTSHGTKRSSDSADLGFGDADF